jgi:hypothetical protein
MKPILVRIAVGVSILLGAQQATAESRPAELPADSVRAVIEKFQAIRPDENDLAVYGLDWAPTLNEAKARAAKEHRPIFLVVVTNSFGNIYTGHC